jgi:hypothetical protein
LGKKFGLVNLTKLIEDSFQNVHRFYLQDIMHSVKRHTANQINKLTGEKGALWQKEKEGAYFQQWRQQYKALFC